MSVISAYATESSLHSKDSNYDQYLLSMFLFQLHYCINEIKACSL